MASEHSTQYQQHQLRDGRSRTPLQQFQTQNTRNARYSYQETPQEHQAATFQPFSPVSPISEAPTSPSNAYIYAHQPQPLATTQFPSEKGLAHHTGQASPYGLPAPQQVHPAYFAPIADNGPSAPLMQVQSPTPVTPYQAADPLLLKSSLENDNQKGSAASIESKRQPTQHETPHFDASPQRSATERTQVYNPDSLAGPNGAPIEHHMPGQVAHPNSHVDPHWKHGLCEPDATCCLGLFCPCIVYGKTQYRLTKKRNRQDPTDLLGYETMNGSCGIMALGCGFQGMFSPILAGLCCPQTSVTYEVVSNLRPGLLAAFQRTRIRKLYKIEGSIGSDCIRSLCCCCCVIAQDEKEMRDREELIRRHAGPTSGASPSTPGYVAPKGMTFSPPPR